MANFTSNAERENKIINNQFPSQPRAHRVQAQGHSQDTQLLSAVRDSVQFNRPQSSQMNAVSSQSNGGSRTGGPTIRSVSPFADSQAEQPRQMYGRSQSGQAIHQSPQEVSVALPRDKVRFGNGPSPIRSASSNSNTATITNTQPPRIRRAQSSSSTTTAGLEKRPSRHADVIDQWDVTGLGKSMWHHSGPYDAAAPSRNDAKERGAERAPMAVFDPKKGSLVTELDSKALGHGRNRSKSQSGDDNIPPIYEHEAVVAPVTTPGAVPMIARPTRGGRKPSTSGNGIYGSLQDEYSNSVPTSGGFAPNSAGIPSAGANGLSPELDEERRMRERDKEQKRRALQAAWGTDEPEPFEDFGGYAARDQDVELNEADLYGSTQATSPMKPANHRSPSSRTGGLTLAGLGRTVSRPQEPRTPTSPGTQEYFNRRPTGTDGSTSPTAGAGTNGGAKGLKRTKSLMQRIRHMRENPNVPVNNEPVLRSGSPSSAGRKSPWNEDTLGIMTPPVAAEPQDYNHTVHQPQPQAKMPESILNTRSPHRMNSANSPFNAEPKEEILLSSETKKYSPPKSRYPRTNGYAPVAYAQGRDKALPPPPPANPVMPDFTSEFDDMTLRPPQEGVKVQRKTSLMKKLKARIG